MTKMITNNQFAVLRVIAEHVGRHGYAPSFREIAKAAGFTSTNAVADMIDRLERDGYLSKTPGVARSLRLTDLARRVMSEGVSILLPEPPSAEDVARQRELAAAEQEARRLHWSRERFYAQVNKGGLLRDPNLGPCWEWAGLRDKNGYGRAGHLGKNTGAHRVALRLEGIEIPPGMIVCHRCDNPPCVRPGHLFVGTPADNSADMLRKGRHRAARGDRNGTRTRPLSRPRGSVHPLAKLAEADIQAIFDARLEGLSYKKIGARFGVSGSVIADIIHNQRWQHVPRPAAEGA